MEQTRRKCPGCKRDQCEGCGIFQQLNTNKQISPCFPHGFQADAGDGLGISFDVGTTTLAGMLWDLKKSVLLAAETAANPQASYGADVVSRIQAAIEKEGAACRLQSMLVKKLDEMAVRLVHRAGMQGDIKSAVMAGNTAMCELLMQIRPEGIAKAPFQPDYRQTVVQEGRQLGFVFLAGARVTVLPPIGGYVGADALAVYSYIRQDREGTEQGNWLAVDIGTNGEILLQCGRKVYACSTAAGPALEGGAVSCGMRAAAGAIDKVSLSGRFPQQDVVCHAIGEAEAKGICGSGLVDVLAVLLQTGAIDRSGYLKTDSEARASGVPERICRRLLQKRHRAGEKEETFFALSDTDKKVYITQKDIRQLQLSIGAIRAGIMTLLHKAGITVQELDQIYLAGAFGSYIDPVSGIAVGLFPDVSREIYIQAGNLAGMGAAMALLSGEALLQMEQSGQDIIHIELAGEEIFQGLFFAGMDFPK